MSKKSPSPSAIEAEQRIIGTMLLDLDRCLPVLKREGIGPRHFYDDRHGAIYSIISEMRSTVDYGELNRRLKDDLHVQVEPIYLSSLQGEALTPMQLEAEIPRLQSSHKRRAIIQTAQMADRIARDESSSIEQLHDTAEQFTRYLNYTAGGDSLPPITTGCDAFKTEIAEPSSLIEGILHAGTKMVLGGGSKSNKTWALLDLGVSVAHGEPWLSNKTRKSKALYVNLELPDWSFQRRLRAIRNAKNIQDTNLLELWHLRGHVAAYDVLLPKIRERIKESGYALVILDPIYKITGNLKENSAEDMTILMNALEALSVECGCAIVFGAHFSKGNQAAKESIDRISGSGVFARDPDTILVMTKHEEDGAFAIETTLRNFKPIAPFVIRWDFPIFRRDGSLDPTKLKQAKGGRTPTYCEQDILSLLPKGGFTTSQWLSKASEEAITRPTFYRLLKSLRLAETISQNDAGKWQVSKVSKPHSETSDTHGLKSL